MRRFESGCSAARPTLFHRWSPPRKRASTGNPQVQRFSAAYADGDPAPRSTAQRGGGSNGRVRASTIVGASRSAGGIWHRYRTRSLERLQPKLRSHRALGRTAAAPSFRLGSPLRPGASCGRCIVPQRPENGHAMRGLEPPPCWPRNGRRSGQVVGSGTVEPFPVSARRAVEEPGPIRTAVVCINHDAGSREASRVTRFPTSIRATGSVRR
jgi:hypothetical protein